MGLTGDAAYDGVDDLHSAGLRRLVFALTLLGLGCASPRAPATTEQRPAPSTTAPECSGLSGQPWHASTGPAAPVGLSDPHVSVHEGSAIVVTSTYSLRLSLAAQTWTDVEAIEPRVGAAVVALPDGRVLRIGGNPFGLVAGGDADEVSVLEPGRGWSATGSLGEARAYAAAVVLEDGSVVVSGGDGLASAERWDPVSETFRLLAPMRIDRAEHALVRLRDGRVLALGGRSRGRNQTETTERFDPRTGTWERTASLPNHGANLEAVVSDQGDVIVASAAGLFLSRDNGDSWQTLSETYVGNQLLARSRCEAWVADRYALRSWTLGSRSVSWSASPVLSRLGANLIAIDDDTVLMLGGRPVNDADRHVEIWRRTPATTESRPLRWSYPPGRVPVDYDRLVATAALGPKHTVVLRRDTAELFEDATVKEPPGPEDDAMEYFGIAVAGLDDATVLATGGVRFGSEVVESTSDTLMQFLGGARQLSQPGPRWRDVPAPATSRWGAVLAPLPGGRAALVGGSTADGTTAVIEVWQGKQRGWTHAASTLAHPRLGHTVTPFANGVLIAGGCDVRLDDPLAKLQVTATKASRQAERWSWTDDRIVAAGSSVQPRCGHAAVPLADGRILVAGGFTRGTIVAWAQLQGETRLRDTEVWDPKTGTWSATGPLNRARAQAAMLTLPDGRVLIAGGEGADPTSGPVAELYDAQAGTWTIAGSLPRRWHTVALSLTGNGSILLAADDVTLDITLGDGG